MLNRKVKYNFSGILILGVCSLFVFSCQSGPIQDVKNSVLDIDKSLTIGEAFENYQYVRNVKWTTSKTNNNRTFVEVSTTYDYSNITADELLPHIELSRKPKQSEKDEFQEEIRDLFENMIVTYRFLLNKDGSVQVSKMNLKAGPKEDLLKAEEKEKESIITELKQIYDNEPSGLYWWGYRYDDSSSSSF